MEALFGINKNFWVKEIHQGAQGLSMRQAPLVGRAPYLVPPWTSTDLNSNSIYSRSGRKKSGEGFIAFYDTEPSPSPKLSWEG